MKTGIYKNIFFLFLLYFVITGGQAAYIFISNYIHKEPDSWHAEFNLNVGKKKPRKDQNFCPVFYQKWNFSKSLNEAIEQLQLIADDTNLKFSKVLPIENGFVRYYFKKPKNTDLREHIVKDLKVFFLSQDGNEFVNKIRNSYGLYYVHYWASTRNNYNPKNDKPFQIKIDKENNLVFYDVVINDEKTMKEFWSMPLLHQPPLLIKNIFRKYGYTFNNVEIYSNFKYIYSYDLRGPVETFFHLPKYYRVDFNLQANYLSNEHFENIKLKGVDCSYPTAYFTNWTGPKPTFLEKSAEPKFKKCETWQINHCNNGKDFVTKNTCNSLEGKEAWCSGQWAGKLKNSEY